MFFSYCTINLTMIIYICIDAVYWFHLVTGIGIGIGIGGLELELELALELELEL